MSFKGPGFDQIRLAAAILVVGHHSWWGVEDVLYVYSGGFIQLGLFAVLVFFSISGFLVTPGLARSGDVAKFAIHRALRIFPALIAVVLASMFVVGPILTTYSLASYFSSPELYLYLKNITTLMAHYLPGVSRDGEPALINGALWTLNLELYSYIALAILSIFGALRNRTLTLIIFGVTYFIYVMLKIDMTFTEIVPSRLINFVSLFVYFVAGTTVFLYADLIPFSAKFAVAAFVLAMAGLAVGLGAVVLPLCLPYAVVYLGLADLGGRALLKHDLSYGVYLIHSPIILVITSLLNLRAGWLVAALTLIVTLVLAYLSWIFVERPALGRKKAITDRLRLFVRWTKAVRRPPVRVPLQDASKSAWGE